jgi:hypothetical protein
MKQQADKRRTDRQFVVRDSVFIKLQPCVQSSVDRRASHKLSFKYFGPSKVADVINPTAYDIALLPDSKIHSVFHVSQLRRALVPGTTFSSTLPIPTDVLAFPVKIIAHSWKKAATGRRDQVQVQWSHADDHDITWEDMLDLQHRFLAAPAWGQADSQGGGDVSELDDTTPTAEDSRPMGRPRQLMQPNRKHVGPEWTR